MRSGLGIVPPPGLDFALCIGQAHEPMFVQAPLTHPAIEALHHGVVGRLARPAEVDLNTALICPFVHHLVDELAAVVGLHHLRLPAFMHDRVEYAYHVFSFEALSNMYGNAFARAAVHDR